MTVGNGTYIFIKYDKIQIMDVTEFRYPIKGDNLLSKWKIKSLNKNNGADVGNFLKSTITFSPKSQSRATNLPPNGSAFIYVETSSKKYGNIVFVRFERTDLIQITIKSLYFIKFSSLIRGSLNSMDRFRLQLILEDNTWSTRYNIPITDRYSDSSKDWTLLILNFTLSKLGIK